MNIKISCKDYFEQQKQLIKEIGSKQRQLHIFQVGDNPASNAYIRGKLRDCEEVGIYAELHKYETITQNELINEIYTCTEDINNKVILQLPVPKEIDAKTVLLSSIRYPWQDVDAFVKQDYDPCTPAGIIDWVLANDISFDGKHVVIIGRSDIVGRPLARLLSSRKYNATVSLCHSHSDPKHIKELSESADIIIVAVGKPKWFCLPLENKLIIDVGINRVDGKLCGDVCYEYYQLHHSSCYVTPVPGGVGLLTRQALLKNVAE